MAITLGTKWYMPIDFGITEEIQKKTGTQIGDYNPRQWIQAPRIGEESIQNYPGVQPAFGGEIQGPASRSQVLGATTSGDSSGGSSSNQQKDGSQSDGDSRPSARDLELDAIRARLDMVRQQANQQRSRAAQDRDYIVNQADTRFPELINRAESRRTSALGELGTEETKLGNLYAQAQAQARRRAESAALKNRMVARANNRLGSSFYDELVASNQEELGRTLGANDLERLDKISAIGTRKGETNRYFDETVNDLDYQKQTLLDQANKDYRRQVDEADYLDRAGVLDFGEGLAQAQANLQSRLSQIQQLAGNLASTRMQMDAAAGKGLGNINDYVTYTSDLSNSLAKNLGLTGAQNYYSNIMGNMNNAGDGSSLARLMALSQNRELDPYALG
jgi:hypothetical protein